MTSHNGRKSQAGLAENRVMSSRQQALCQIKAELEAITRQAVQTLDLDNDEVCTVWRAKFQYLMHLLMARRRVRIGMLIEARAQEKLLEVRDSTGSRCLPDYDAEANAVEALRRATDDKALMESLEEDIKEFKDVSVANSRDLVTGCEAEDRKLLIEIERATYDDATMNAVVDTFKQSRLKALQGILDENSKLNREVLAQVGELGLDDLDARVLQGSTLENHCFDN